MNQGVRKVGSYAKTATLSVDTFLDYLKGEWYFG